MTSASRASGRQRGSDLDQWLSLHVFFHDARQHTRMLRDCIVPCVRRLQKSGAVGPWFIVRNWKGGPHVRLRFRGDPAALRTALRPAIDEAFQAFMASHPVDRVLERDSYYRMHAAHTAGLGDPAALPWYAHGTIEEIPYEPEVDRYGGQDLLPVSEELFEASTELAIALLAALPEQRPALLTTALDTMLLTSHAFGVATQEYFSAYAEPWRRFISDDTRILEKVESVFAAQREAFGHRSQVLERRADDEPYRGWLEAVRRATARMRTLLEARPAPQGMAAADVLGFVAASHIHMNNNRLGIVPGEEMYLGMLLARSLAAGEARSRL